MMKPLSFLGSADDAIRAFPDTARRDAGYQLYLVQRGLQPDDWRPMPSIGAGRA
jgi:phage-related protein